MKVLGVAVDELPEGCEQCIFVNHSHPEGSAFCEIGRYDKFGFESEWINISKYHLRVMRPNWCPLVIKPRRNGE